MQYDLTQEIMFSILLGRVGVGEDTGCQMSCFQDAHTAQWVETTGHT